MQYTDEQKKVLDIAATHLANALIATYTGAPSAKEDLIKMCPTYAENGPEFWAKLACEEERAERTKYSEDCVILEALWGIPESQVKEWAYSLYGDEIQKAHDDNAFTW